MDTTSSGTYNLNELVYHHTGSSAGSMSFYVYETGDEQHFMSPSFSGHDYSDGIAVSTDNVNWQRAWQMPSDVSTYTKYTVDLTPFSLGTDFYIKFQQYDDYAATTDGIFWDDIILGTAIEDLTMERCEVSDNGNQGAKLSILGGSIKNCTFDSNPSWALNLTGGGLLVQNNNFISNNGTYKQCADWTNSTMWDNGTHGNFWSEWTAPDMDRNGIVDVQYDLTGPGLPYDAFPLSRPFNGPRIQTANVNLTNEDELYSVQYAATDIDSLPAVFTWDMDTNAGWLGHTDGLISGTPGNADVGIYWVNVSVSDGRFEDWTLFDLEVLNVNDAPTIITSPNLTANEDEYYLTWFYADDIDPTNDNFTWSVDTNATWLNLDTATGNLSGTPVNDEVGTYYANVTVDDGKGGQDSVYFEIDVLNTNDAPTWVNYPSDWVMLNNEIYVNDINATDVDVLDVLTYSMVVTPSTTISMDPITGGILWSPVELGHFNVNVSASDGQVSIYHEFNITVNQFNRPPVAQLSSPGNVSEIGIVNPTFKWTTSDPDDDNVTCDLYLSDSKSSVLGLQVTSRIISNIKDGQYTPPGTLDKGKIYYWTVIPYDGELTGHCTSGVWSFKVNDSAALNHLPKFVSEPLLEAGVGTEYNYIPLATDEDPLDMISYSYVSGPVGMKFDSDVIIWTPTQDQIGTHGVKISASDGKGETFQEFIIEVTQDGPSNNPPVVLPIKDVEVTEGETVSVAVSAVDDDGDLLSYEVLIGHKNASIDSSGAFTWITVKGDAGVYDVVIKVLDGTSHAIGGFRVTVLKIPDIADDDDDDTDDDITDDDIIDDDVIDDDIVDDDVVDPIEWLASFKPDDEEWNDDVDVTFDVCRIITKVEEDVPGPGMTTSTTTYTFSGTCSDNVAVIHIFNAMQKNDDEYSYSPFYDPKELEKLEIEPEDGKWSWETSVSVEYKTLDPVEEPDGPVDTPEVVDVYTFWYASVAWSSDGSMNMDETEADMGGGGVDGDDDDDTAGMVGSYAVCIIVPLIIVVIIIVIIIIIVVSRKKKSEDDEPEKEQVSEPKETPSPKSTAMEAEVEEGDIFLDKKAHTRSQRQGKATPQKQRTQPKPAPAEEGPYSDPGYDASPSPYGGLATEDESTMLDTTSEQAALPPAQEDPMADDPSLHDPVMGEPQTDDPESDLDSIFGFEDDRSSPVEEEPEIEEEPEVEEEAEPVVMKPKRMELPKW